MFKLGNYKAFLIIGGIFGLILLIRHLLGGDDRFLNENGLGLMFWISLIGVISVGLIFYFLQKK